MSEFDKVILRKTLNWVSSILVLKAAKNYFVDGKDIFGRKRCEKLPKKTRVNWKDQDQVIAGTNDFQIE